MAGHSTFAHSRPDKIGTPRLLPPYIRNILNGISAKKSAQILCHAIYFKNNMVSSNNTTEKCLHLWVSRFFQNSLKTFAKLSPPTWIKNSLKYPKGVHITVYPAF
jgi:hypothetical protein